MMKLSLILITSILFIASLATKAQDFSQFPSWQIPHQAKDEILLSGPFQQAKTTPYLRRPLKSTGTLTFSSQQGLLWHTQTPIESILVLNKKAVISIDSKQQVKKVSGASDINLVFADAMFGKWDSLTEQFDLSLIPQDKPCVLMLPKTALTKKTIKQLKVCGSNSQIEQIHYDEASGATTKIDVQLKPIDSLNQQQQSWIQQVKQHQSNP